MQAATSIVEKLSLGSLLFVQGFERSFSGLYIYG